MPLVYITGPTAAGKSALREALTQRGYEAHDTDEDGIAAWFNRETGEAAEYPENVSDRTHTWLAQHEFLMERSRITELRSHTKERFVFLCGIPGNALGMADLFDTIICLVIDEHTMLDRVASRTANPFGKAPAERELIIRYREPTIDAYRTIGALMVDATRPINVVVNEVLALCSRRAAGT